MDEFAPINIDYVNLGIETGFIPKINYIGFLYYTIMHQFARTNLKLHYPNTKYSFAISPYVWASECNIAACTTENTIGDLPALRNFVNDQNDYIGVGHYPNAAQYFHYNFGSDQEIFADGPNGWNATLNYIDTYAKSFTPNKSIAIMDTGISSNTVTITSPISITIAGSEEHISQWTYDLGTNAIKENYLFINWWNSVDYDPIWITSGSPEATSIWVHMGLWGLDMNMTPPVLKEKDGLCTWRKVFQ